MKYLSDIGYYDDHVASRNMDLRRCVLKNMMSEIHLTLMLMYLIMRLQEDGLPFLFISMIILLEERQSLHDGKMIHPKTGTVLVFPSVWTFPHSGLPVKSGSKYILTTYFHYV